MKNPCRICERYMPRVKCEEIDCPVAKMKAENLKLKAENKKLREEAAKRSWEGSPGVQGVFG